MRSSTTIRVCRETADGLRNLAAEDDTTITDEIALLVRAERQRRMGRALARAELDSDAQAWLDLGVGTAARHARR